MDIAIQVGTEIEHELGLGVYTHRTNRASYALAVIDPDDGAVVAWDGWYGDLERFNIAPEERCPLSALADLDDRDTTVAQFIVDANLVWLPVVGALTWPWYSADVAAERTMRAHGHHGDQDFWRNAGDLVAYFATKLPRPGQLQRRAESHLT